MRATEALAVYARAMRNRGLSPETVDVNLRTARRFLVDTARPATRLRTRDVTGYLADLQRAEVAPATQGRVLAVLRSFARALVEAGALDRDPTEGLVVARGRPVQCAALSAAAVSRLLSATDECPSGSSRALALRDRALLELLYGLGLRSSEARAALVTDLNLADGSFLVRAAKRGHSRTLPLPRAALPYLRRYLEEGRPRLVRGGEDRGHLIVTKTGNPLGDASDVGIVVAKAATRAGVPCHPHALRRALATHLVLAGVNVRAVQVLLGHRCLAVTARYLAVDRAELRRTIALLERRSASASSVNVPRAGRHARGRRTTSLPMTRSTKD